MPPPNPAAQAAQLDQPTVSSGVGQAIVMATPPGTPLRVGGGPYTVPISITNVSRLSTITVTITFDPAVLRVRTVQEGSFMRSGGANAVFTQQTGPGRVDMTVTRAADSIGASGTGLIGAILVDALAPGTTTLSMRGAATGPGGPVMGLQFRPASISIQP